MLLVAPKTSPPESQALLRSGGSISPAAGQGFLEKVLCRCWKKGNSVLMTEGAGISSGEIRQVSYAIGKARISCKTIQGERTNAPYLR